MKIQRLRIYNLIAVANKDKPASREYLIRQTGLSDRQVRKGVEDLRDRGVRVCGLSKDKGYWIAKTDKEYQAFRADYTSKAKTILRRARRMDGVEIQGQVSIYDVLS